MTKKTIRTAFDIKSANLPLISFVLKTTDLQLITTELQTRFGSQPDYFSNDPAVLDISQLPEDVPLIDFAELVRMLKTYSVLAFAVKGNNEQQLEQARNAGLILVPEIKAIISKPQPVQVKEVVKEVTVSAVSAGTMVVDKPLRSGQQIYARGCDLIVTSLVSFGAEIIADGNIHVYAPLRGRVIAGAQGNMQARIYSTCFEPELLAIAGIYRTTENPLPNDVYGKPVMVSLENENLKISPIKIQN